MTEIEIIKRLFKAFSIKEKITVSLADGSKRNGVVVSFDGEMVLLNEAEIAITSIVHVGNEETAPCEEISVPVVDEHASGFVVALLSGNKDEVERYFSSPEMLAAEGFSDQEVESICRKKSTPLPWGDDERNAIYNHLRHKGWNSAGTL